MLSTLPSAVGRNGRNGGDDDDDDDEAKKKNTAPPSTTPPPVRLHLVQQWTASLHAVGTLRFAPPARVPGSPVHFLATGSTDGTVHVWDVSKRFLTHNLRHPQGGSISCVAYSDPPAPAAETAAVALAKPADSDDATKWPEVFAVGTFTGYVSLVDFVSKKVLATAQSHTSAVIAMQPVLRAGAADSAPGSAVAATSLLTLGRDRKLVMHAPGTLTPQRVIAVHDECSCAAFAQAGRSLLLGNVDGSVASYRVAIDVVRAGSGGGSKPASGTDGKPAAPPPVLTLRHRTEAASGAGGIAAEHQEDEDVIACVAPLPGPPTHDVATGSPKTPADPTAATLHLLVADAAQKVTFMSQAAAAGSTLQRSRVFAGSLDQVLDVKPLYQPATGTGGNAPAKLPATAFVGRAVATNSKDMLLFDGPGAFAAGALRGHVDLVVSLQVSKCGTWLASGSKDATMRLWHVPTQRCVGVTPAGSHATDVAAIAFSSALASTGDDNGGANNASPAGPLLCATAGIDEHIRLWDCRPGYELSTAKVSKPASLVSTAAVTGNQGGAVYCIALSPNDGVLATGGKDKSIALWTVGPMKTGRKSLAQATAGQTTQSVTKYQVLHGHRRPVNAIAFSTVDKLLASASGDGAIKLWAIQSGVCAKTLQVDTMGATQVSFFNRGTQLAAASSDGMLRVWAVGPGEAVATVAAHSEKVWSLSVVEDGASTVLLTGGVDGCVVATEDYTAEHASELSTAHAETVEQAQLLENALRRGQYAVAFKLALKLGHTRQLRRVVTEWGAARGPAGCEDAVAEVLTDLSAKQLTTLLEAAREWLTNARHSRPAAIVVAAMLRAFHPTELATMPAVHHTLEALVSYTERHVARVQTLQNHLWYLDWLTRPLRPAAGAAASTLASLMPAPADEAAAAAKPASTPAAVGASPKQSPKAKAVTPPAKAAAAAPSKKTAGAKKGRAAAADAVAPPEAAPSKKKHRK